MLTNLDKYKILLASKSPRRRELLQQLRVPFHVVTLGGIDESFPDSVPRIDVPQFVSEKKADAFQKIINENELVITADTMVICEDRILGKPKDAKEAKEMLHFLADKTHKVATGVTVTTQDRRTSFTTVTEVTFGPLTDEEIDYYVDNFQPFDKAGAYGIQEWIGAVAVSGIKGSYHNVMGLPVHRLYQELKLF
ncbi:MAG: Maf family nucleotide pyrophosphatase [Muribaculaceae bacterium]|nr:Maf family nucleotide pyrophosphatase [Muribaculaceae bacterium]